MKIEHPFIVSWSPGGSLILLRSKSRHLRFVGPTFLRQLPAVYHTGTTKAMTSTGKKIENGRTQGRTATSFLHKFTHEVCFVNCKAFFFHSSRLSNMASYGCIGNCTCPVSDFKGMHLCRFHLLKNQSSQEKPSCPICPILTIWKYCVDTQHYTRMAHVHVPEHLAFCFLLFVESGCASHHLSLSFGMVQSVMKNLAAYACNLYVLLQEPCSIAHSIAVSSWQTLIGLGAGMGTKLFGNPASHSGEKESQGGTSCLQTVRVDVWRSTRNSCKTLSRQATRNQCLLKKSTLNTVMQCWVTFCGRLCAVLSMAAVFALAILQDPFLGNKSHAALWGQVWSLWSSAPNLPAKGRTVVAPQHQCPSIAWTKSLNDMWSAGSIHVSSLELRTGNSK